MDNQQLNILEIWKPVKNFEQRYAVSNTGLAKHFKVSGTQISRIRHGHQRIIV